MEAGMVLRLLARGGFVRPMAGTPNSAARWPYLMGLATAANKYEVPPHGVTRVERMHGEGRTFPEDVPRSETSVPSHVRRPRFARLEA